MVSWDGLLGKTNVDTTHVQLCMVHSVKTFHLLSN